MFFSDTLCKSQPEGGYPQRLFPRQAQNLLRRNGVHNCHVSWQLGSGVSGDYLQYRGICSIHLLSLLGLSTLGKNQHLLRSNTVQELRCEHLRGQQIQRFLEMFFECELHSVELKQRTKLPFFNAKIEVAFFCGFATRIRTEEIHCRDTVGACYGRSYGFDFINRVNFITQWRPLHSALLPLPDQMCDGAQQ